MVAIIFSPTVPTLHYNLQNNLYKKKRVQNQNRQGISNSFRCLKKRYLQKGYLKKYEYKFIM